MIILPHYVSTKHKRPCAPMKMSWNKTNVHDSTFWTLNPNQIKRILISNLSLNLQRCLASNGIIRCWQFIEGRLQGPHHLGVHASTIQSSLGISNKLSTKVATHQHSNEMVISSRVIPQICRFNESKVEKFWKFNKVKLKISNNIIDHQQI